MSDDDEYEAIEDTTNADGGDPNDAGAVVSEAGPVEERQIGRIRRVDDTARKLFADAAKALKPQIQKLAEDDDDLAPVIDDDNDPPAAAAGSVPAPANQPSGQSPTQPAAAAPAPASPAATAIDARTQAQIELREKALADREAQLAAREQSIATRENARERYIDRPGETIRDLIKEWTGISTDDELKDELADLMTDLSAVALNIPVPDQHKTRLESRKAVRTVKHYKAQNAARDAELAKKAEEQAQAEREHRAISGVESLLTPSKDKFPHLMAEENPAAIVWDVIKTKHARDGLEPNWEEAAKLAEDHFKKKNDAYLSKRRHLLAPAAAQAAVSVASAPQGHDPQSRRSSTLTNKTTVAPVSPKAPAPQQNEEPAAFDRDTHRRQSFALFKGALKETPAT